MKIIWKKFLDSIEEEVIDQVDGELVPMTIQKRFLTPMGHLPDDFNLWIGHTDFKLTNDILIKIKGDNNVNGKNKGVDGVEILTFNTPYRFVLGVGMAFDDRKVKRDIQEVLGIGKKPVELTNELNILKKDIKDPYWAIYIGPNGESKLTQSENMETVYTELETFRATQKLVGGHVEYWKTISK
jgi:hypothetical protein